MDIVLILIIVVMVIVLSIILTVGVNYYLSLYMPVKKVTINKMMINTSYKIGDTYGEGIIVNIYEDEEGMVHLLVVNSDIMQNVPIVN